MFAMSSALAERAEAQENLDAGKSPSQIFAGTCTACHKSPRGLMKTVSASSLPGFLRQHYTTSSNMAGVLASYLISNGATDTRYAVGQPNPQQKGAKEGARDATHEAAAPSDQPEHLGRRQHSGATASQEAPEPHQAARPDAEGTAPQAETGAHWGRNGRQRLARPTEAPDATKPETDGLTQPQAAGEHGGDGRRLSPKRLSRRGKPGEELPKEPPKTDVPHEEPASAEPASVEPAKTEAAKSEVDGAKPDGSKPPGGAKSNANADTATIEPPKEPETPALRVDPVPPVTPAPGAAASEPPAATAASGVETPTTSAVSPPPAVTASTPAAPPVAPAGPPAPPISQ